MSWGTCYNGSNNIHFNLPPLMSDGRNFTTLTPARQQNTKVFLHFLSQETARTK